MRIKFLSVITSFFFFAFALVSCLGDNDPIEYTIDDTIRAFGIDKIYDVDYKFTIDQIKGRIFNVDSFPHTADTIINKILITTLTATTPYILTGDTLLQLSDSIDFSNTMVEPMELEVVSIDGTAKRKYSVEVRIHQQDPDSLIWKKLTDSFSGQTTANEQKVVLFGEQVRIYTSNNSFYYSSVKDGENWGLNDEVEGLPEDIKLSSIINYKEELYVLSATGKMFNSQDGIIWSESPLSGNVRTLITEFPEGIAAVINDNEINKFALSNPEATLWEIGEIVPEDFPVDYISSTSYVSSTGMLKFYITGQVNEGAENTVPWSSYTGKGWTPLQTDSDYALPAMQRPAIMYYGDKFYAYGDDFETFYISKEGLVWKEVEEKVLFPEEFQKGSRYSTLVDNDSFIWIVWDKTGLQNDEVWKGRLNKLGFKILK